MKAESKLSKRPGTPREPMETHFCKFASLPRQRKAKSAKRNARAERAARGSEGRGRRYTDGTKRYSACQRKKRSSSLERFSNPGKLRKRWETRLIFQTARLTARHAAVVALPIPTKLCSRLAMYLELPLSLGLSKAVVTFHHITELEAHGINRNDVQRLSEAGYCTVESVRVYTIAAGEKKLVW